MFTGIIETTGIVKNLSKIKDIERLSVYVRKDLSPIKIGDSVAVNGACLTVVGLDKKRILFDIMKETSENTAFRFMKPNDVVNLERAMGLRSRAEGHFVLGHIDRSARVMSIKKHAGPHIEVGVLPEDMGYVVRKGSIAIDGVSLTISGVYKNSARAHLIPHTLENTNLNSKKTGDRVNLEFDILGKYIQNSLRRDSIRDKRFPPNPLTEEILKNAGFI